MELYHIKIIYNKSTKRQVFLFYFILYSSPLIDINNQLNFRNEYPQCLFSVTTIKKMMQSERILPSWETFDPQIDFIMGNDLDFDFSSSFTLPEESSVISSNSHIPTVFSDDFFYVPNLSDEIFTTSPMETINTEQLSDICEWINENDHQGNSYSPCFSLESGEGSMVIPQTNMEMDTESSLHHLVTAYGEATENGQKELAQVILNSIEEKSDPLGNTIERLAFYLFQLKQNQGDYLRQESLRNFNTAHRALYGGLPWGRLAHFVANSEILQGMPQNAAKIHIIDFDIEDGIQWPPVIEAISRLHKSLRFTLIKSDQQCSSPGPNIEETKRRLKDHAREFGMRLQIEEKSVFELESELMRAKTSREWLAFNCMFRLPHMARMHQRSDAAEFLHVAKKILANHGDSVGIVTLGYGETEFCLRTGLGFSSLLDNLLKHYQALFESLEQSFPIHLADARIAIESIFLSSYISSSNRLLDSEEFMGILDLQSETGLRRRKLSEESLVEAKEMVDETENAYKVKVEGENEHEMVLEWKGTPLVRVSTLM